MNGEIMSDIDNKPAPESTAIPLDESMDTFRLAFNHITSVLIDGNVRIQHPFREEMKVLQHQLADIGIDILGDLQPGNRLGKFALLLDDYKNQLAGVGYRAFLDENILIVETIEARP